MRSVRASAGGDSKSAIAGRRGLAPDLNIGVVVYENTLPVFADCTRGDTLLFCGVTSHKIDEGPADRQCSGSKCKRLA
jgi:hypothetical protein